MRTECIGRALATPGRGCALRTALWAAALAAWLAVAPGATPARAQPQAADEPRAEPAPGSQEATRPGGPEQTAGDEAPEIFVPSEEISGDTVVSFPVDI